MLDVEVNRGGVPTASRGAVLRGIPLMQREAAGTGASIDVIGAGCAGGVGGSSTICTCGSILEFAGSETISSRELEIETLASLRNIDEWGREFSQKIK